MINLRASLLNGCGFCIGLHKAELRKLNEPTTRIDAVERWQQSEAFTPRERAVLAWTDVLTDLRSDTHASDADYAAITQFFQDKDLVDLTFAIANMNAWNRMGVAFRPEWRPRTPQAAAEEPIASPESAKVPADSDSALDKQAVVNDDGGKVAQD